MDAYHSCESNLIFDTYLIQLTSVAELPLIFGTHYEFRGNSRQFEWELSEVFEGRCRPLLWMLPR
jgi:hypothetical protein